LTRTASGRCLRLRLHRRHRGSSFHDKQIAQEVVAGINGMTRVVNEIQVE
jgi:hypothetical protein